MLESPAPLPVPPVKFKRRKVSAIRDFPAGCGPTELPPALDAPVEAFKGLGRVEDGRDSLKLAKSPAKGIDGGVVKVIEGRRSLEVEKGEEVVVKSLVKGIDRVVVEKLDPLKKYPPPRRRKVSVTRDFPVGCGSIDLPVNGVVSGDGIVDSKSMALFAEKNSVEKEMPVVEGLDKVELNGRVEGEAERRDVTGSQWRDVLEIGVAAAAAASIRESLDATEKAVEECRPISNGLKQMEIAKNVEDEAVEAGSNSKQPQPRDEKTGKMETLDGVKKLVMKQKVMEEEGLDQVASVVKLGGEVRNEIKEIQVRVPENSGTPQDMPPTQNSGLNESVVESEQKQKIIVNSVSKKKIEVHEMRQVIEHPNSMEARESKLFSPDATSPSGSRVVDGDARSLVVWSPKSREEQESKSARSDATTTFGSKVADRDAWSLVVRSPKSRESQESKPPCSDATSPSVSTREIYKGSFRIQKSRKNLGKRSYEELEDEGFGINAQADSALVASGGDRLIIQALMSAQNCPWRQDSKKSLKSGARSVTPINKMKKEGNQACTTRMGVSHSHDKSIVVIQDDKDPLVWEAETPKPLVAYRKPHEIDVSLAPLGPSVSNFGGGDSDGVPRNRVKRALRLFQVISRKLLQEEEAKKQVVGRIRRIDLAAANILKDKNEWVYKGQAFVGVVPGVEVGDEFHYRVELSIVGLHRPFQGGIDSTKVNGMPVATSIVASGGYPDDMDNSDVLIYSGSGGNPQGGDKQPGDQKLERGNLALKNSIEAKAPVRVIHGFKENKGSESHDSKTKVISTFTYDGLYLVEDYWQERGPHGFYVFKFRLRRVPGQPDIGLKQVKKSKHLKVREGLCIKDISEGKEIIPICVVNTIDNDRPAPFVYTPQIIYPSWYVPTPPAGCNCANGCSDSNKCACAVKNGGEIPFNFNGNIIQAKPLVYECGPSCKCPPTCYNRVSQHGVKVQLEIFKTTTRGWGARSLYSIPSGSFICEYTGELLRDTEAEQKHNDEYLFDIGHNYDDQSLWEGLPSLVPPLHSNPLGENKEDVGFTIDAAEYGNVGRFINHSCSPNLYAQNVLYDHDDRRIPHIMLFAADNIPPLQELTYHYNYTIDHVRDSEGNIKQKDCYCGAPDCTGRLY